MVNLTSYGGSGARWRDAEEVGKLRDPTGTEQHKSALCCGEAGECLEKDLSVVQSLVAQGLRLVFGLADRASNY